MLVVAAQDQQVLDRLQLRTQAVVAAVVVTTVHLIVAAQAAQVS